MPICYSFRATSAKAIEHHINNNKNSTFLYVYMAQSMDENAPPICNNIFGTDNCITFEDVAKRYAYITSILEAYGIKVSGYSADGDTRVLKAMRQRMKLGEKKIFSAKTIFLQNILMFINITGYVFIISQDFVLKLCQNKFIYKTQFILLIS